MRNPASPQISSFAAAETTRRTLEACIVEIQSSPALGSRIIANVELADGVETTIAHKLGRVPRFVRESCPRNAVTTGRVVEVRGAHDRSQVVVLKATGYGATIIVDVEAK